jgi:hypothetical protein
MKESNAPTGGREEIEYPVHARSTAQPDVDKERICAIRIILRTTGKSTSASV